MDKKILNMAKSKGKLSCNNLKINNESVIIIDFYNVYCDLIKFNHNKTFSKDTFDICIKKIVHAFKKYSKVIIISKDIYEVDVEYIYDKIKYCKNVTYIIVKDMHEIKSKNRERDDYACFLFFNHYMEQRPTFIVSNDKFKNYSNIIKNIKKFSMQLISYNDMRLHVVTEFTDFMYNEINRLDFTFKKDDRRHMQVCQ